VHAVIRDSTWWDRYHHRIEGNWEPKRLRCYSSQDTEGLAGLIANSRWSNEGLFALLEGLRRLAQHNPSKTSVPTIEVTVG
jgi:hypothetical protein